MSDIDQEMSTHVSQKVIDDVKEELHRKLSEQVSSIRRREQFSGWFVLFLLFIGSFGGAFFLLLTFPAANVVKNANRWDDADRTLYLECMRDTKSGTLPVDGDRHEWCVDFVNVGFSEK